LRDLDCSLLSKTDGGVKSDPTLRAPWAYEITLPNEFNALSASVQLSIEIRLIMEWADLQGCEMTHLLVSFAFCSVNCYVQEIGEELRMKLREGFTKCYMCGRKSS
jgi:hypothetical protein